MNIRILIIVTLLLCGCRHNVEKSSNQPSRAPYPGFHWEHVKGAGLDFWAQHSDDLKVVADNGLPGAILVDSAGTRMEVVMQLFTLENRDIADVLRLIGKQSGSDECMKCKFEEIESGREGVGRYILKSDGAYAQAMDSIMRNEPVTSTCSGFGTGNSGMRYFEIHDSHPDKALFVEIGQEQPLFDEKSIVITD